MTKSPQKHVDFNSILMGLNFLVACLVAYGSSYAENNAYIDQETIVLGLLLCLQTHIALQIERRRRDPFVTLLAFTTILYFSFRIFTLAVYPFSVVFERYSYGPQDSNYAMIFIIVANLLLYAGFLFVKFPESRQVIAADNWRPIRPSRIIGLMVASIIYAYFAEIHWTPEDEPRIVTLLGFFISPNVILLMALCYFILFRRSLSRGVAITIAALIFIEMAAHTLAGSRSGIVTLIQNVMVAVLAIVSFIRLKRGLFFLMCAASPIVAALLVGTFAISTYNRVHLRTEGIGSIDVDQAVELAGEASSQLGENSELDVVLPPIFDRAGFFDYSAEIIANSDRYKEEFNLATYAKSIIDNLLTPGFDVYDQPKIANALVFIYADLGEPSKERVVEEYQSDQFGIYGEFYALFNWVSLPLFFLTAALLKRFYVRLRRENPFVLVMMRVVVLSVWIKIINSYGLDWTIIETVPLVAAIYLYTFFFRARRVRTPPVEPHSFTLAVRA